MKVIDLNQLREAVRRQRRLHGLTQTEAAALIGHTQKWLSDFESGKVDPPASMVIKIMMLMGIPLQFDVSEVPTSNGETETEIGLDMDLEP